jgi:hypothetical protein
MPDRAVGHLRHEGTRETGRDVVVVAQQRQLGELIDQLGVRQQVDQDETVCGAVVLLTVQEPDGHLSLRCAWSDGMSWIERIGLLRAAERAELPADGAHDWRV